MGTLHGKTAVILGVLGATNRIGAATARRFVPEGAEIVVCGAGVGWGLVGWRAVGRGDAGQGVMAGRGSGAGAQLSVSPSASPQAKARARLARVLAVTTGRPNHRA